HSPLRHPPPFPTRRSSDLANKRLPFRLAAHERIHGGTRRRLECRRGCVEIENLAVGHACGGARLDPELLLQHRGALLIQMESGGDRKSTRLNSSHVAISYA